jgi:hypothetical protein
MSAESGLEPSEGRMQWVNVTAEGVRTLDFDISADIVGRF